MGKDRFGERKQARTQTTSYWINWRLKRFNLAPCLEWTIFSLSRL